MQAVLHMIFGLECLTLLLEITGPENERSEEAIKERRTEQKSRLLGREEGIRTIEQNQKKKRSKESQGEKNRKPEKVKKSLISNRPKFD